MTVGQANLNAALGVQELGTKTGLQAALANQQYNLEGQRAAEQSKQFGATQGLAGAQAAGQMAQTLSNIGSAQQQADAQRLALQQSTAAQEQALNQQKLDLAYGDWQKEVDNPYTQLQRYMNILSGVPQATNTTTTSSAPTPSIGQQLLGAGLTSLGAYKMGG
jgi:hypothetical protein